MEINVTGRNLDLDDSLKQYVYKRLSKVERLYRRIYECRVILEEEKSRKNVEVILYLKNNRLVARDSSPDMFASIDNVSFKIQKQLRRLNDKVSSRRRKAMFDRIVAPMVRLKRRTGGRRGAVPGQEGQIVKIDAFADKPMLPEEARLELELMERDFIMFKNADTGEANVLYKRGDGKCGLIEPGF